MNAGDREYRPVNLGMSDKALKAQGIPESRKILPTELRVSQRCDYAMCKYYEMRNENRCSMYTDRRRCSLSMKKRKKTADHSRRNQEQQF